ncbi:aminopeptidase P family protein [Candidatus Peregrinibacteria bacterium]|jgi:Xaa-Pro aminopeptidase|nr:aminopeptidase P family protein [Candidatus Peregrinibacteria bacterium]MBT7703742.1 aminopeptidase P family protein [Candidatus Peregrinibacteria bacterium]
MAKASLITDLTNVFYLTGLKSSNAGVLQTKNKTYLITDGRYLEKAQKIKGITALDIKNKEVWPQLIKKHRLDLIEYEGHSLKINSLSRWKKKFPRIKWQDNKQKIEKKRAQKSSTELRKISASQRLNEQIFRTVKRSLKTGVTELEIAKKIQIETLTQNAEKSFDPIIAFGTHTSDPHHEPTKRKLKKGDLIMIDMGVTLNNYASDMTRMLFTNSPTSEQEKIYNLVLQAQENAILALKPRKTGGQIDRIARQTFQKNGHQKAFLHSLGHGLGLQVHEFPNLAPKSKILLKPGMVVTIEPGLYFPGKFGIRIEDLLVITPKGSRNLTKTPKVIKDCLLRKI